MLKSSEWMFGPVEGTRRLCTDSARLFDRSANTQVLGTWIIISRSRPDKKKTSQKTLHCQRPSSNNRWDNSKMSYRFCSTARDRSYSTPVDAYFPKKLGTCRPDRKITEFRTRFSFGARYPTIRRVIHGLWRLPITPVTQFSRQYERKYDSSNI